jgi:hypothetical protein
MGHPHVLVYLVTSDSADLTLISSNLASEVSAEITGVFQLADLPLVTILAHTESQVDPRILQSCDALVVALDGSSGVGAKTIEVWNLARDLTLPRHVLAFNVVHGRADFDELCAIASRTMEPDLLVRYLPIDSDDELSLTGVYDILTSEIHALVDSKWITRPADPEHIALTSSAREDLFEQLAYLGLDDATLKNHQDGLPISVTRLESAWSHPDLVAVTPIDDGVGAIIFRTWLTLLTPVWIPIQVSNDLAVDVTNTSEFIGIAVTEVTARIWGHPTDQEIGCKQSDAWQPLTGVTISGGLLRAQNLIPGVTICNQASSSVLVAPVL